MTPPAPGAAPRQPPPLDVDGLLDDPGTRVIVCCGAGGVGKTTTAAALGLRAAERGRRVVVLTIDPARRLAQSMGLDELDNTPRPVRDVDGTGGGRLDAMMLDMKRTFDEVIEQHATPDKAAQIFENPFYQALSSSFAGHAGVHGDGEAGAAAQRELRGGRRPDGPAAGTSSWWTLHPAARPWTSSTRPPGSGRSSTGA